MSDTSSPSQPSRMVFPAQSNSLLFSHHATHPLISPFNSPNPNFFVSDTSRRSLPPLTPPPADFVPRPIPPMPSPLARSLANVEPLVIDDSDQGVSAALSGLQFDGLDRDHTILAHSQAIATLESKCRRYEDIIERNEATIKDLSQLLVFTGDIPKLKSHTAKEFLQVHTAVDSSTNLINMRLAALEGKSASAAPPALTDPPYYAHLSFSGEVTETRRFCSAIRDSFARLLHHFADNRDRIVWIAGYFKTSSGNLGDPCPSYSWWRGLLTRNAHKQDLPTKKASALDPFVITELVDASTFLLLVEETFSSHTEEEDARKALMALRQGNKSIANFNIQFNTLLFSVDLSKASKCKHYDAAINPKIIHLGINRGWWSDLTTLAEKQRVAVCLAKDVGQVSQINQQNFKVPPPRVEYRSVPSVPLPAKPSQSVPMDIDSALAEVGFTWPLWRDECTKKRICFRCAEPFDRAHVRAGGCIEPDSKWLDKEDVLPIWKSWGGALREDCRNNAHVVDRSGADRD
ncbi:hypothetical protein PGTUg99_050181 [Puccinia graminis f. sp. tritici]|uniref:Retrotransposon gag domain-containing protein n=1 Tax=Puccinia graminis f. sp. tritici TaxID=56615 RepID=A0A5B0RUV0_PUCGR|nr:hypothetical protein PGTUg99_050181 [Puccinia graminis f. sp. tritici]